MAKYSLFMIADICALFDKLRSHKIRESWKQWKNVSQAALLKMYKNLGVSKIYF